MSVIVTPQERAELRRQRAAKAGTIKPPGSVGRPRTRLHTTHEPRWGPNNQQMLAALMRAYPAVQRGRTIIRTLRSAFPEFESPPFARSPDAFALDRERRMVDLFEIEVTHSMPRSLLLDYGRLDDALRACGVTLGLFAINRYGHANAIDLCAVLANLSAVSDAAPTHPIRITSGVLSRRGNRGVEYA